VSTKEWPRGTRVTKPGYGYVGEVSGYETKFRTRWCVVHWQGRPFTERENPSCLEVIPQDTPAGQ
jgi:hypothetical protein